MFEKYSFFKMVFWGSLVLFLSVLAPVQGAATDYPTKPIQLIVPYAAGGVTDIWARLYAPKSAEYLGQPMVVVNKPGAGGALGLDFVAKAKPDGYTLGMGAISSLPIVKAVNPRLSYDPVKDFTPICRMSSSASIYLVRADSPFTTFEKLVDYAKKNPGKLNYGTSGAGATQHFACELLQRAAEIKMVHVPYKGDGPALMAILGGHVDLVLITVTTATEQIKAGKVIPLAVTSSDRHKDHPNVPSVREQGYAGAVIVSWSGIVAPAGIPETVREKLGIFFQKVLASPDVEKRIRELGATPYYLGPKEFAEFIRKEVEIYGEIARKANIKVQ